MKSLGEIIKSYRESLGMTLEEVSRKCDITRNYLHVLETGQGSPTLHKIEEICKALEVSVVDLLSAYYNANATDKVDKVSRTTRNFVEIFNELNPSNKTCIVKILNSFHKGQSI